MVEINNQRKAFLDMLAWSEGTDNGRQKNQKSWLWRHCRRRAIYWLPDHPRKTVTLNPKPQINRRRTLPASSCWWDAYRKQLVWKTFRKIMLGHCSRLRSVALYLWLIVVISVRQIDRRQYSIPLGAIILSVTRPDSPTVKFKEAAERSRDWRRSRVTAIIPLGYLPSTVWP